MNYLLRRTIHAVVVLAAVSILSFLFLEIAPGDYFDEMRLNPRIRSETVDQLRGRYGVDLPFGLRYVKWIQAVASGSWGFSFAHGEDVAPLLFRRAWNTLLLALLAAALAWAIAIPTGVFWAARPSPPLALITSALVGLPEVVLALGLLMAAHRSEVLPAGGMKSYGLESAGLAARGADFLRHAILPVTALALPAFGILARHVRSAVSEALDQPFVRSARARGLGTVVLYAKHVLPSAANPLIALASLSVASLLSGSLAVEVIVGWPGLGPFLLDAILARDVHVVIGGVMCSSILVVAGGFLGDVALYFNDPRSSER